MGQTCSVGVGLLPAAHQCLLYLQWAGNLPCPLGGKHINCAAVKMSKKIKIVVVGKPAPRLELLSILEGLGGWMDVWGFFYYCFYYLPFLSCFNTCHHSVSKKLGKLDSRFKCCCFTSMFCFLITLSGTQMRRFFLFFVLIRPPAVGVSSFLDSSVMANKTQQLSLLLFTAVKSHWWPKRSEQLLCSTCVQTFYLCGGFVKLTVKVGSGPDWL